MNHEIKCPRCGGNGYKTFNKREGRWFFDCITCGDHRLLKELNNNKVVTEKVRPTDL